MASPVVRGISPLLAGTGCEVTLFGCGFSAATVVDCGGRIVPSGFDESSLAFTAPSRPGTYTVRAVNGENASAVYRLVVVPLEKVPCRNLPVRTDDDYRDALLGLFPRGFAWFKGKGGNWWKLVSAFAVAFCIVYETLRQHVRESSPLGTTSFDIWERELGLPRKGLEFSDDAGRRSEIYRIARRPGGCTVPYFEGIAALFGKSVEIFEYWKDPEPFAEVNFGDDDPNFYWAVKMDIARSDMHVCTCNDTCNDYLRWWWDDRLEAMFELIKPAHTKLVFLYGTGRNLLAESGDGILAETGETLMTEN